MWYFGVPLRDILVLVSNTGGYEIVIVAVRFGGSSHRKRGLGGAVCFGLFESWEVIGCFIQPR
jgi:hypothetical protein